MVETMIKAQSAQMKRGDRSHAEHGSEEGNRAWERRMVFAPIYIWFPSSAWEPSALKKFAGAAPRRPPARGPYPLRTRPGEPWRLRTPCPPGLVPPLASASARSVLTNFAKGKKGKNKNVKLTSSGKAEAQVVDPAVRRAPVANGRTAIPGVVAPAAAPAHPVLAR